MTGTYKTVCFVVAVSALVSAGGMGAYAQHDERIPSWVRSIFVEYSEGHVSDEEILDMLGYLVESGIISPGHQAPDRGDVYTTYLENPNSMYADTGSAKEWMQGERILEYEADYINANFHLPYDIDLVAGECGEETTYYHDYKIVICYEFVDDLFYTYFISNQDVSDDDYDDMIDFASVQASSMLIYVIYHELAHALIDMHGLPIDDPESAADQFASLVLLNTVDDQDPAWGQYLMEDVVIFYTYKEYLTGFCGYDAGSECAEAYWSGHGSHAYRISDFDCYAYGADPIGNQYMIGYLISEERAVECELIYPEIVDYWNGMLDGYTSGPIFSAYN